MKKLRNFFERIFIHIMNQIEELSYFFGLKIQLKSQILSLRGKIQELESKLVKIAEKLEDERVRNQERESDLQDKFTLLEEKGRRLGSIHLKELQRAAKEKNAEYVQIKNRMEKLENSQNYLLNREKQLSRQCLSVETDYTIDDFLRLPQLRNFMDSVIDLYRDPAKVSLSDNTNRVIVLMTDATVKTGLVDRIRTMLTTYVIAAESGMPFHIYHDAGFDLQNYLIPNEVNWAIDKTEIKYDLNKTSLFFYLRRFRKLDKINKDYHFFQSQILVDYMLPDSLKGKYSDNSVFHKLFHFHPAVVLEAEKNLEEIGCKCGDYVSLHCRFLNFFQQVEVFGNTTSTPEQREKMLKAVHATAEKIHKETGKIIILFSDSDSFLQKEHPCFVRVLKGAPGHIVMNSGDADVTMKAFVDLLIMSKGSAVYSLRGDNLYASGYSRCAAVAIGGIPYMCEPIQQI